MERGAEHVCQLHHGCPRLPRGQGRMIRKLRALCNSISGGIRPMNKTLVLQDGIYAEIVRLAGEFEGLEFAITLFGFIRDERFEVTHFAPPGKDSEHAHSRCTNDHEFESDFFSRLRKEVPGIQYIGDLHAHPPSYPRLSSTDYATVKRTLFGTDDTLHPEEYVAGIILPLRRAGEPGVAIVPTYFSKQNPSGSEMELEYVHAGVCTKSDRACRLFLAAYSRGRRRIAWKRNYQHLGAYWRRLTHAR